MDIDDDAAGEVSDAPSDSDTGGPLADTDSAVAGDSSECILDGRLDHIWSFATYRPDAYAWVAPLSNGYFVGRIIHGPGASRSCFQMRWSATVCDAYSAVLSITRFCNPGEPQSFEIVVELTDPDPELTFEVILIDGIAYEVLFEALPSELDANCASYTCNTEWHAALE